MGRLPESGAACFNAGVRATVTSQTPSCAATPNVGVADMPPATRSAFNEVHRMPSTARSTDRAVGQATNACVNGAAPVGRDRSIDGRWGARLPGDPGDLRMRRSKEATSNFGSQHRLERNRGLLGRQAERTRVQRAIRAMLERMQHTRCLLRARRLRAVGADPLGAQRRADLHPPVASASAQQMRHGWHQRSQQNGEHRHFGRERSREVGPEHGLSGVGRVRMNQPNSEASIPRIGSGHGLHGRAGDSAGGGFERVIGRSIEHW